MSWISATKPVKRGARLLRYVSRSRKCGLCPSRSTLLRHKAIYAFWDRFARARCPRPEVPAERWERFTQAGKAIGVVEITVLCGGAAVRHADDCAGPVQQSSVWQTCWQQRSSAESVIECADR